MKLTLCLLTSAFLLVSGCVPFRIMQSMDRDAYGKYRIEAEQLNLERERAGLAPNPVLTFEEWKGKPASKPVKSPQPL